jgi:hypothetical protein
MALKVNRVMYNALLLGRRVKAEYTHNLGYRLSNRTPVTISCLFLHLNQN